ncbi:NADH-quinone oxidoreductase subunit L [Coprothermobacter platensis]|uniref:NADH-quinone oxidoreductase subunit 5 family protein n=1 Tax=Coprothermobacter platensis TaxID=108819 RepID=UPI00037E7254|nr:NADH-quinone oxidoreductase subunit L [Coprothermobacter platensis]
MQISLLLNVLLPFISAVIVYFLKNERMRNIVIIATALVVMASSVVIAVYGYNTFAGHPLGNINLDRWIAIGDLLLSLYILYISVSLKNAMLILLTLLQLIPMFVFENFSGANLDVLHPIYADHLSVIMNLIVSFVGTLIWIYAISYMREDEEHKGIRPSRQNRFFFILLLFIGAMNALIFSNDLIWVYFFWEITTISSFLLIGHDRTAEAKQSSTRALLLNSIGGVMFVIGIILGYHFFNTVDIQTLISHRASGMLLLPFAFLCLAAFTKSAQIPFQSWLLGAMVAPTPVSALLHSSTMVKAGVYLILRLVPAFYGSWLAGVIAIFGAFTFITASLMAISQSNGKKILAYSTIANLGLIISAAAINSPVAVAAAIMLLIFHAISKALLFLCVGTIEHGIGSRDIEDMRGLINKMPFTTLITVIGLVTMLLPPFGVLLSKWLVIETAAKNPLLVFMIAIGSALTVVYYARWIGILLSRTSSKDVVQHEKRDPFVRIPLSVLAMLSIVISVTVTSIFNGLIAPQVVEYFHRLGVIAQEGSIGTSYGGFSLWPVFLALALALLGGYVVLKGSNQYAMPYAPGESAQEYKVIKVAGKETKMPKAKVSNYYFSDVISENRLTPWLDVAAAVLIVAMFGVVIL